MTAVNPSHQGNAADRAVWAQDAGFPSPNAAADRGATSDTATLDDGAVIPYAAGGADWGGLTPLAVTGGATAGAATAAPVFSEDEIAEIASGSAKGKELVQSLVWSTPHRVPEALRQLSQSTAPGQHKAYVAVYHQLRQTFQEHWKGGGNMDAYMAPFLKLQGAGAATVRADMVKMLTDQIYDRGSDILVEGKLLEHAQRMMTGAAGSMADAAQVYRSLERRYPDAADELLAATVTLQRGAGGRFLEKLFSAGGKELGARWSAGAAVKLTETIASAKDPDLQKHLSIALGKFLAANPKALQKLMHDPVNRLQVDDIVATVLRHDPDGKERVGEMVARLTEYAGYQVFGDPERSVKGQSVGRFLALVEAGIKDVVKGEKAQIRFGADILRYSAKAVEKLSGQTLPVGKAVDALEKWESGQVDKAWNRFSGEMRSVLNVAYKAAAERYAEDVQGRPQLGECDEHAKDYDRSDPACVYEHAEDYDRSDPACVYEHSEAKFSDDMKSGYDKMKAEIGL